MAGRPNAILAISSTDRYIKNTNTGTAIDPNTGQIITVTQNNQPTSNFLQTQFLGEAPYSNDFSITAPNALINGYIDKIVVSQIQLQYYLPTVIPGSNDTLFIFLEESPSSNIYDEFDVSIPYGFYSPVELAAILQIRLNADTGSTFTVSYSETSISGGYVGYNITNTQGKKFCFAGLDYLNDNYEQGVVNTTLKTYRLFGMNTTNASDDILSPGFKAQLSQGSSLAPVFLYTPYIDIYSDALTNYQNLKDADSSTSKRKGLLARIYLSGVGSPQFTSDTYIDPNTGATVSLSDALGSKPFLLTYDLNTPKIIQWTDQTAINSLDFQMRDCYGDLLFVRTEEPVIGYAQEVYNTEFQMTLLCIEG
jgi:hypothetical protein